MVSEPVLSALSGNNGAVGHAFSTTERTLDLKSKYRTREIPTGEDLGGVG